MDGYENLISKQNTIFRILCLSALILTAIAAAIYFLHIDGLSDIFAVGTAVVDVFLLTMAAYVRYRRGQVMRKYGKERA